ncbi:MAG: SIS domain-containing protein [Schaedlerella sp.]|uniref:KpsF/GutQ family sugar-phosphate isomerase n=1 Tax=Schaedlerella sp. TaxID=2676057 RepID=UPI00261C6A70|nr:SIS domain-containing protein [uncultured Schaedlerella sp.]
MEREKILYEIRRCLQMEADSVRKQQEEIEEEAVLKVAETIRSCTGKIILSACGTSAMAAKKIAHSLNCIECPALFLAPSDAVHGGLGVVQQEDVVILISKGGNTEELVRLLPACKTKKAVVIAVSENPDSRLAVHADIYLKIKVEREPCRFNMLATASTMAVIAVFDAVCIALMQMTGYSREQFAVIHPGGAVGERLLDRKESVH